MPLRSQRQFCGLLDRYAFAGSENATCSRTFSLLPKGESGSFSLAGDNYIFANDAETERTPTWYTLQAKIPYNEAGHHSDCMDLEWAGLPLLRPSAALISRTDLSALPMPSNEDDVELRAPAYIEGDP